MYILKQLFFSISVKSGFRNTYLATSWLGKYFATIHFFLKEGVIEFEKSWYPLYEIIGLDVKRDGRVVGERKRNLGLLNRNTA